MPACLYGQSTIRGIVIDSLTQEPMSSATVYVNGTTQGTSTDADGRFELQDVKFPATVVFSFVGYQTQAIDLVRYPGRLTIRLKTNDELPEVVVSDKDEKSDLEFFKQMFLGEDRWGKHAKIKNENVILVNRYIRRIVDDSNGDKVILEETEVFDAWASEPLIIDLPLLGYELYVDLVKFSVERYKAVTASDMLGYFYYKPYDKLSKLKAKNIEENRRKAYHGSSQHFLRSLSEDRLEENGFILSKREEVKKRKRTFFTDLPVDIRKCTSSVGENMTQVSGLKDETLKIKYYHRSSGTPLNFRERPKGIHLYSESGVTFLKDSCVFRKEGIVVDNNIRFKGDISKRRVGSCLPDDYYSLVDSSKIMKTIVPDYADQLFEFVGNIEQFNSMFPQEKVYLEFDNTAYFQGENIWYKAFVTHATTLERSPSGVLYVDFLAPTGQLILQQKLKIEDGQADGAIALIDGGTYQTREKQGIRAYPSGFYEIRAYTKNMLDFSPEAIFSRVIPVYTQPKYEGEYDRSYVESNQDNPLVRKIRGESDDKYRDINVAFYPEGGDLVSGLPCRVAFKATGSDAYGIEGTLKIPEFWDSASVVHDGMGSFIITTKGYTVVRFIPSGSDEGALFTLPMPLSSGYSMMADMNPDSRMQVNIWRTEDRIGEQTALAVTCRGDVVYFREINDIENSQFEIDCSDWPVGVCRVTLYDKDGMILSSRSIFNYGESHKIPTIALYTDSMSRQSCDKEVIKFKLTDQKGNPFRDRFCLSVRDATDYGGGRTDNLQTNLLLSSDLRGYIHDAAWYLESDDEEHREALNLLTLVQGWERYEWQTMTGLKDFEERHRIEEGLTMNGWILSYRKREPVSGIGVYANLIPDDDKTLFESFEYKTDSTGYFGFDLSDFYGRGKFNINLMSANDNGKSKYEKSKRIRFERADRPEPRPYYLEETDLTHNDHRIEDYKVDYTDFSLTSSQRRKLGRMIDDVDIEEPGVRRRFIDYDTFTSFEAEEDAELELDKGELTTDVRGYLLEQGINIAGRTYIDTLANRSFKAEEEGEYVAEGDSASENDIQYYIYAHDLNKYLNSSPRTDMIDVKSIIIYDNPMFPREFVDLVPLAVDYCRAHNETGWFEWIETSWRRYYLIDVQIKEARELLFDWEITNLGRRTTTVKGFTRPVQFYSPQYPDGPIEGSPDYRRTLYWNPNVITDEDGRARVEFYNNSFSRKFTINAAGITASGIPYILNENW